LDWVFSWGDVVDGRWVRSVQGLTCDFWAVFEEKKLERREDLSNSKEAHWQFSSGEVVLLANHEKRVSRDLRVAKVM
jgi:hypothetical protein